MPGYDGMNGRQITAAARDEIARLAAELAVLTAQSEYPNEHRSKLRRERVAAIRLAKSEAERALREWARAEADDARRRMNADDVGTAAAESRRVANELRISRLTAAARSDGSERTSAADLAERANLAYERGNLDEAEVLATASQELGTVTLARDVIALVKYDRIAADPARARGLKDLGDVDVVMTAAARDLNAAYSGALQKSVALARAIGENSGDVAGDMTAASVDAKMAAWFAAQAAGTAYQEPDGVAPGHPLGDGAEHRMPGELASR